MTTTRSHRRLRALALGLGAAAGVALAVTAVGTAAAAGTDTGPTSSDGTGSGTTGDPSTQSPTQGLDAALATLDTAEYSFLDAAAGNDRPDGADGTETEFPGADPRFVEGPAGGLVKDGPFA